MLYGTAAAAVGYAREPERWPSHRSGAHRSATVGKGNRAWYHTPPGGLNRMPGSAVGSSDGIMVSVTAGGISLHRPDLAPHGTPQLRAHAQEE
jgi:hypothetical protein